MPAGNPLAYFINPELFQQQAAGMSAANELKGIPNSSEYALALRDAAQPINQQGNPAEWGYAGPTFMDVFANLATRSEGRKKLGALDTRAEALRKQAQEGQIAELNMDEQRRQQEMQFTREMEDMRSSRPIGGMETFTKDGEIFSVQRDGKGDVTRVEPLEGATPYALPRTLGAGSKGKSYAWELKEATPAIEMMKNIDDVRGIAEKFTDDDEEVLNQLGKRIAQKAFTPELLEQYIQMNWNGYSREVKDYLTKMLAVSAEERHRLAGSALTKTENSITNAFLPSADGITLSDRMDRIGGIYNRAWNKLSALDATSGSDYSKRYGRWKTWERPTKLGDTPQKRVEAVAGKLQRTLGADEEAIFDEYMELNDGVRHPSDPRSSFGDKVSEMIGAF